MEEHLSEDLDQREEGEKNGREYSPPQLIRVGKAVDLVRGLNYGKNNDGYSGFYWER